MMRGAPVARSRLAGVFCTVTDDSMTGVVMLREDYVVEIADSDVLMDPAFTVPAVPGAATGVGWIRCSVARFCEGTAHARRRDLTERVIARIGRAGDGEPAVPVTRRVAPDGHEILVDLATVPFGAGRHACPGQALALHLADANISESGNPPDAE